MKVFITGATGFLGKHVLDLCVKKNFQVLILSRKRKSNKNSKNIKWVYSDLSNLKIITNKLKSFKPDIFIHLAWENIPDFSSAKSLKNLYNSVKLFECVINNNSIKKIICAGSCFEYSNRKAKCKESDIVKPTSLESQAIHLRQESATIDFLDCL